MEKRIHGHLVVGAELDGQTRCRHYRSPLDVVAIRFYCCDTYYSCIECHREFADHDVRVRPRDQLDRRCVLCGVCGYEMTANEYFECRSKCPKCDAEFNPGCELHRPYYFS